METKNFFVVVLKNAGLIVLGAVLGLIALLLVHMLPTAPMRKNVSKSLGMIEREFSNGTVIEGFEATLTGSFTDCMMLEYAIYASEDHSILEQVLNMYRRESSTFDDEWWPAYSLRDYLEGIPQPKEIEYSRYWHGYLLVLKPLLLLASFNQIRLLNAAIQLLLAGCVLICFCREKAYPLAMGFLMSLPFLFFISTYASLSLSICFYIMIIAILVQIKYGGNFDKKGLYGEFFLMVGMVTAYFDFLTYPLVTLVYPLCVYLYFYGKGLRSNIGRMISYSVRWFCGYMGLWMSKWVLADLLTDSSAIKDALHTLLARTDSAEGYSRMNGFFIVLFQNFKAYTNWCFVVIVGILAVVLLRGIVKMTGGGGKLKAGIPYIILALYPFIWFFFTQNHSKEHWQYTCRILSCSVFAGLVGWAKMCKRDEGS